MRLGILGGSFNPVHNGHLYLADAALSKLKLDRVVLIPAFYSPFKLEAANTKSMENTGDRLDMLAAAASGDMRLTIDNCEIIRKGVSYTVDTVQDIITRYQPTGKPALIIGDDLAAGFPKWRNSKEILELANIVIGRRFELEASAKAQYPFPHALINNEVMNISSKIVRQRINEGKQWRALVPSGVRDIIEDRRLYGYNSADVFPGEDCSNAVIARVELAVRQALSTERYLHSKNTAIFAVDLCRRFGLNPMAGYLAGITHDLAKQIDGKLMLKLAKTDGLPISSLEKDKPGLLHGRAGAVLLKERFCIHNKDVLEAVAFHTMGNEDMRPLAKVIYIADKTEMTRNIDPALRKMCLESDLDSVFFAVVRKTVSKLQLRELDLSEATLRLLDRMKEKKR